MLVLVCGSRRWSDGAAIYERLAQLPPGTVVLHGGARGADLLAGQAALQLGLRTEVHLAAWRRYGRRAGYLRNRAMLDRQPELVLAFRCYGASPGTDDTVAEATRRGIPVELHAEAA